MSSLCGRCCRLFVYSLRPSQPRNRRSIRLGQWSNLGGKKRSMSLHSKDIPKEFYKKIPKVELHVHLDGSLRLSTLMEVAKQEKLDFPEEKEEFHNIVSLNGKQPSLVEFLKPFKYVCTILSSSLDTIERCSYEFCEDSALQNVVYTEPRASPHLLSQSGRHSPEEAVKAMLRGIKRGERDFGIKARVILCMVKGYSLEWAPEVVELAKKYRSEGVVGIDIAGDESVPFENYYPYFEEAKKSKLNITVHAGESGPASNVKEAIEVLGARRIGHGYHCVEDHEVIKLVKEKAVHLEACPLSSICTNSGGFELNSLQKYVEHGLPFSVNSDDASIMRTELYQDYQALVEKFGVEHKMLRQTVLHGADAAFLPDKEKQQLVDDLKAKLKDFESEFEGYF